MTDQTRPSEKRSRIPALLAAIYLPVMGGFDFVFIEYISDYIDSVNLVFIRVAVIAIIFYVLHRIKQGPLNISPKDRLRFFIAGGIGIGTYYIIEAIGIAWTSASLSSIILATVPLFSLLGDRLIYKTRITPLKLIGVVASIIGVAIIIFAGGGALSGGMGGIGLLFLASAEWAAYIIIAKPLNDRYPAFTVTTGLFVSAFLVTLPIFLLYQPGNVLGFTPKNWALTVIFAVVCIAIAQLLYMVGVKALSVTTTAIVMNLLPLVTVITSWIVFHEMLTPLQLFGGAIILAAITVVARE